MGASHGVVTPLPCTPDCEDPELAAWGAELHTGCILATTHLIPAGLPSSLAPDTDPALHKLASNIKSQTLVLEKMCQDKSDYKEAKKCGESAQILETYDPTRFIH